MFDKSRYGIVRGVAVHLPWAQVSRGSAEGIALLTLFCKTGGCAAANAVRTRCVETCAARTALRVTCARWAAGGASARLLARIVGLQLDIPTNSQRLLR